MPQRHDASPSPPHAAPLPGSGGFSAGIAADALPRPTTSEHEQLDTVHGMLGRLLPQQAHLFRLAICARPHASHPGLFRLRVAPGGCVHIEGTSGVELAAGIHHFLKHWTHSHVSWSITGGVQINAAAFAPAALAQLAARPAETVVRRLPLSYYQNVVTASYSTAFWEWERCGGRQVGGRGRHAARRGARGSVVLAVCCMPCVCRPAAPVQVAMHTLDAACSRRACFAAATRTPLTPPPLARCRWEQEIDWAALQGINLPLAPAGSEAVWADTFTQDFALTPADLAGFFTGPAFLAWCGWGPRGGGVGGQEVCTRWGVVCWELCAARGAPARAAHPPTASAPLDPLWLRPVGAPAGWATSRATLARCPPPT